MTLENIARHLKVSKTTAHRAIESATAELDEYDCFVETVRPFPRGNRVNLQIARSGQLFSALGRVAYISSSGMGIVFSIVDAESRDILRKWLVPQIGRA